MSLAAIDTLMGQDKIADGRATLARIATSLNRRNAPGRELPPLILLTDDQRSADYAEAMQALPPGSAIIIRHRNERVRRALAQSLRDLADRCGVRFLIAGDAALAHDCDADGMHAGEANLDQMAAWRGRYPYWLITGAIHGDAASDRIRGADALLLAPVFPTQSHPDAAPLGVAAFDAIAERSTIPIYPLGGITAENAELLTASRAAGIALIGGWIRV